MARPAPVAVWPIVVGVICIIIGAGGGLLSLWTSAAGLLFALIDSTAPEPLMAAVRRWMPIQAAVALVNVFLATMLLVGGIGLIARRPWSWRLLVTWACLRAVHVVPHAAVAGLMQRDQLAALGQTAGPGAVASGGDVFSTMIVVVSVAFTLLWGWALPGFLLVWRLLPGSRREVARWRESAAPEEGGHGPAKGTE